MVPRAAQHWSGPGSGFCSRIATETIHQYGIPESRCFTSMNRDSIFASTPIDVASACGLPTCAQPMALFEYVTTKAECRPARSLSAIRVVRELPSRIRAVTLFTAPIKLNHRPFSAVRRRSRSAHRFFFCRRAALFIVDG